MIGVIQPACYASIVKKADFRNISEQNVHMFICNLSDHFDLYLKRCQIRNTTIPVSSSGVKFNMRQNNAVPFNVVCFVSKFCTYFSSLKFDIIDG